LNAVKKHYALLTSLLVFFIYLFTLAPSVVQIDAGELATVQATLGIAHPTGYPLFSIIGFLFLKIPLPITKIVQANLLAAIWCSLGIFVFINIIELLFSKIKIQPAVNSKTKGRKQKIYTDFNKDQAVIASISGALFLALSKTYWMQSTSVEVYSLQVFLFMLIIFVSLKVFYKEKKNIFDWVPVGLAYAFGFANHMTTMLLIPFSAILFFQKEKFVKQSFIKIAVTVIISIPLLILFYSFLPVRAAMNPPINWGNPVNMENILRHISGKQYQVWLFTSLEAAQKQFKYFLTNFPSEFAYIGLILGAVGFVFIIKQNIKLFAALTATFVFTVLYSINYDIVDIDSYFLLAYIMFAIFISLGILKLAAYFKEKSIKEVYSCSIIGILCFVPLAINNAEVNQGNVYAFEDYTKSILAGAEKNSIIFSYQWDYFISPSYYFQNVENFRKDLTIIDKELMRRSWYFNQLKTNHPNIINRITPEYQTFLESLKPFERGDKFDSGLIEKNYRTLMTTLVAKNITGRNFYIGPELFQGEMQRGEFTLPEGYQLVPYLLNFKVVKGSGYIPAPDPNFTIRLPKEKNKYIQFIENTAGTMLTYRAAYELQFNRKERARVYLSKVIKEFSGYQVPFDILKAAGY
jgi:hypothetical protein